MHQVGSHRGRARPGEHHPDTASPEHPLQPLQGRSVLQLMELIERQELRVLAEPLKLVDLMEILELRVLAELMKLEEGVPGCL